MEKLWVNDRNFNDSELERQKYYYVVEHNDLITKARHELTARQLKIIDFIISKIKPSDEIFQTVKTSMYELCKVLNININGKNYSDLATSINDLRKKEVTIYDQEERTITQTGWVVQAKYWENGQIQLSLSNDLAPYLLQLKSNYTQYFLADTVQLKSKYSILLYKLMREAEKDKHKIAILQGTPNQFKEWLGAPNSYNYNRLKDNIINKAILEINAKIKDMELEVFQARRGRKVVQVEIHNNFIKSLR